MNIEFVDPFVASTVKVLATMANTQATPGKPFVKSDKSAKGDVTGIVGLTGNKAKVSLAITFTEAAILHIYAEMLGEHVKEVNDSVIDCVGEITNMLTGGAKAILAQKGHKFELAIPSMISGRNHTVSHHTTGQVICVPLDTPAGSFSIEVCYEEI